jgi:hypothetical protein
MHPGRSIETKLFEFKQLQCFGGGGRFYTSEPK